MTVRPFLLRRDVDTSGVSGLGDVAEGCEFSDGTVALRWASAFPTSVVFHERGMAGVEAVHGHGGATRVVWLPEPMTCSSCGRPRNQCRTDPDVFLSCCPACSASDGDTHHHARKPPPFRRHGATGGQQAEAVAAHSRSSFTPEMTTAERDPEPTPPVRPPVILMTLECGHYRLQPPHDQRQAGAWLQCSICPQQLAVGDDVPRDAVRLVVKTEAVNVPWSDDMLPERHR